MLPAKFGLIWPRSFRGEDLFIISQSETRIALGSHICWPNGMKRRNRCFLPSLAPFGQAVSEEKIFLTVANQKKELLLVAMFIGRMEPNEEAL
jgi:hypothetical protein